MTKTAENEPILSRINNHYKNLPPSERKLADLILDFPGDIASYSATELASQAKVSKAAASRLFCRLGYENFEQARRMVREEQAWGSPLYKISQPTEIAVKDVFLQREMEQEMTNMARTFEAIEPAYLERIVKKLVQARNIWLLGYRHSYFIAGYASAQFLQIRNQVHLMVTEGTTLAEQIVNLHSDDIVLAVGFRRRTSRFRNALKSIHKKKIPILYITEPNVGSSVNYANWVLHAEITGNEPFDSYPAAFSLIHLLSVAMLKLIGREGRNRIQEIEDMHTEVHDFD